MIPIDLPPESAIIAEMPRQTDALWNNHQLSFEGLLTIINRLEKIDQVSDQISEEQIISVRKAIVQLAQIGSLNATSEELDLLAHDIVPLFVDERVGLFDYEELLAATYLPYESLPIPYYDGKVIPCKSIRKMVKHVAHKIAKFIRKHKTEIIAAGAAITAVTTAVIIYNSTQSENVMEPFPEQQPEEEIEITTIEIEVPSTPIVAIPVEEITVPVKPIDASTKQIIWEQTANIGAAIAHQVWDGIGDIGSFALDLRSQVNPARIPFDQSKDIKAVWGEDWVPAVHKLIDDFFNTEQSILYEEKYKNHIAGNKIPIGIIPIPGLNVFKDAAKVASGLHLAEDLTLAQKQISVIETRGVLEQRANSAFKSGILVEPALNPIRIRPDGIWEINGKNIKRFDLNMMMKENKVNHIFNAPRHNLEKLGLSPEATFEKLTKGLVEADKSGKISPNEPFKIRLNVDGHEVEVRGIVIDGELKYSTFFIVNK